MTLRDLTEKELLALQKVCQKEFAMWSRNRADILPEEAWKAAWSNALKVRLDLEDRPPRA